MSDIFIKSDINNLINSMESESIALPQWLNIIDISGSPMRNVDTETSINNFEYNKPLSTTSINSMTSEFNNQQLGGDNYTATSENFQLFNNTANNNDIFISQLAGTTDNAMTSPDDINNLINMLTSEKKTNDFDTVTTITNTTVLENQLRGLLEQAGGGAKKAAKKSSKKASKKSSKKSAKKASKKSSKKSDKKSSKKASKKSSKKAQVGGAKKASKKSSKKAAKKSSKKASKKSSKKVVKKSSKKASKKSSKKASKKSSKKAQVGGAKKASKKSSKKTAKKSSKKASKKSSKKVVKKASKKASKKYTNADNEPSVEKKKKAGPAHAALQTEIIKMIMAKDGINYPAAMGKLKEYVSKALGKPYEKGGDITYIDALKKTKAYLSK